MVSIAFSRTSPPAAACPGSVNSLGEWLIPPTEGTKTKRYGWTRSIETINNHLILEQRAIRVVVRADAKGPVIEVIDRETQQVVRQIPSDKVLKLAAWFEENGLLSQSSPSGLAFDKTA